MIGKRQAAAKAGRRDPSAQGGEQRLCGRVGNRQHRNFQDGPGILERKPLGPGHRAHARSQRIAAVQGQILNRAALHGIGRPIAALRIGVALAVAVVARIGVNQAAHGAMFVGQLRLQPAPAAAIARQHDAPLDAHALTFEFLVVVRHAVICVDQFRGYIAIGAVHVVGRQFILGLRGCAVAFDGRLGQSRLEMGRRDEFHGHFARRRIQHRKFLDGRIPAPLAKLRELKFGIRLVVRGAHMIRLRRHLLHPSARAPPALRSASKRASNCSCAAAAAVENPSSSLAPAAATAGVATPGASAATLPAVLQPMTAAMRAHETREIVIGKQFSFYSLIPVPRFNRVTASVNITAAADTMIP